MTELGWAKFRLALLSLAVISLLAGGTVWVYAYLCAPVAHAAAWSQFREVDQKGAVNYDVVREVWPSVRSWTDFVDEIVKPPESVALEMRYLAMTGGGALVAVSIAILMLLWCTPRKPAAPPSEPSQ